MRHFILFAPLALLLLISSCLKETDHNLPHENTAPERGLRFYASIEGSASEASTSEGSTSETKVYADENLKVRWNADDRITIFEQKTYNKQYYFDGEDGDNSGAFEPVSTGGFYTGNALDNYYAVYPYAKGTKINNAGTAITLTLPAEQTYKANSFGIGANTMIAVSADAYLPFKNVGGYLGIRLYGENVSVTRVTLQGNNGEKIAGKASVAVGLKSLPVVTMDGTATESVSVVCDPPVKIGTSATDYTEFWFVLPPVTFSKGFTITVEDELGGTFSKSASMSFTVQRSTKDWMSPLPVVMQYANVPVADPSFKAYCLENFDTNHDGEISSMEAMAVTEVNVCTDGMSSLEGVKHFKNLTILRAEGSGAASSAAPRQTKSPASGQLSSIDLSGLVKLEQVHVSHNGQMTELVLTGCTSLQEVDCSSCSIDELDLSTNTALESLNCDGNQLTSLDLTSNTFLSALSCDGNDNLESVWVNPDDPLTSLTYNGSVTTIYYGHEAVPFEDANFKAYCVTNFDNDGDGEVSLAEALEVKEMDASFLGITSMKGVEYFKNLQVLYCFDNQLTSLDVSSNTALTIFGCTGNQLTSLDVSANTALEVLLCSSNQLTSLDVSANTALTNLSCDNNQLTSLDVSANTALFQLFCCYNQLTSLDVSANTALDLLDCSNNQLTNLNVSANTALWNLSCSSNQLTNLDISKNTALTQLYCNSNQLVSLDVSANTALDFLDCSNNQLTNLNVSACTALVSLNCHNNQLTSLYVSKNIALNYLYCYNNQLATLDVSANTALTELRCYSNPLTSLDVSFNTALTILLCHSNQLTSLDVSKNIALNYLYCYNNQLTSLDVSANSALEYLYCTGNPALSALWLKSGQAIAALYYDSNITTIYYKD